MSKKYKAQKYKLYQIDEYKGKTNKFIENEYKLFNINEIKDVLSKDKGYHIRISSEKDYIFFGDCDGYKKDFDIFATILVNFLDRMYKINLKPCDVLYTQNESKKGSYHYSIPVIYASCEKLKEIHTNFYNNNKDEFTYTKDDKTYRIIDTTIYSNHWFRLPNQSKEGKKKTKHIIRSGEIIDFFVEYIPAESVCINNNKFIGLDKKSIIKKKLDVEEVSNLSEEYEQTDFTDDDVKKLCSFLLKKRMDDYKSWIDTGMCLKNLSNKYLKYWIEVSKKSKKFDEEECTDKWKSFKVTKSGYGIGSLIMWCKEDNKDKCKNFLRERNIKSFVERNKDKFPDNDLEVSNIITNNDYHYISLNDKYCPIMEKEHKNNNMFLELTPYELVMKCNRCVGHKYPCDHIKPTTKDIKQLFSVKIDNLTVNNYYGDNNNIDDIEIENIRISDDEEFDKLIVKSLNGTHYDIAEVLFYLTKDKFVFADKDTDSDVKIWYEFYNHRWNVSIKLRNLISKMMPEKYEMIINEYKKKLCGEDENIIKLKIKKIKNIIKTLKTSNVKNNIMTELEELSQIEWKDNFYNKLDSNLHLFGFNNGVYDFKKMEFRNGKPDDYISMTCGYDYIDKHTKNLKQLKNFINDIQSNDDQLDYLLTYISTCLAGRNFEELFTILTGVGRNGKSKFISLIKKVFGDYSGSVSSKLFTRPRPDASAPDPGLLSLTKKRIVFASEPEKADKMNSGFIKFVTGNDSVMLRKCHGNNMCNFQANFITFLICNDIPDIDEIDGAFCKRLRCVPFETVFCDNPKNENERKINKNIESELDGYAQDLMLLLIEKYKKYLDNDRKLVPTPKILEFTNSYKDDVDTYLSFLNECTIESEDECVHISDLYSVFKNWFKNNNPNEKLPTSKNFNSGIKKHKIILRSIRIGTKVSTGIKNLKMIDE